MRVWLSVSFLSLLWKGLAVVVWRLSQPAALLLSLPYAGPGGSCYSLGLQPNTGLGQYCGYWVVNGEGGDFGGSPRWHDTRDQESLDEVRRPFGGGKERPSAAAPQGDEVIWCSCKGMDDPPMEADSILLCAAHTTALGSSKV